MKKYLAVLMTLCICFSNVSMPILAVSQKINSSNTESIPYAIVSENYTSKWSNYQSFYYDYAPNANKLVDVRFRVKATYRYNEVTGKIYGSPGTLRIEAETKPYNYSVQIKNIKTVGDPVITSDGYAWVYSNVTFDFTLSYDNGLPEVYSTGLGTIYVPGSLN